MRTHPLVTAQRREPSSAPPPTASAAPYEDWNTVFARVSTLSERELEVFRALGEGASNRRIAGRLAITERTVKAHVAQVLTKLRVESRLQAGIIAFAWTRPAHLDEGPPFRPSPVACGASGPLPLSGSRPTAATR
ncbi:response regulator transcription factor [Streptomyces purpurogeneiscleroticus]|uniref:response regulator transcription factor n=1 Tax=Streptomyces purpurogeneiscleroticus TaxID=68259 RepID=UPI001CBF0071|nr:helix-turn-helix transcriptional regulator [Streptomyces purpurogeneiscleroticus]MBZ4019509.1 hypothetical protein [Streptomyces purpurogeneiscleroticus]